MIYDRDSHQTKGGILHDDTNNNNNTTATTTKNKREVQRGVRGYTYDAYLNRRRSNRAVACTYCIILYTDYRITVPGVNKKTRDAL